MNKHKQKQIEYLKKKLDEAYNNQQYLEGIKISNALIALDKDNPHHQIDLAAFLCRVDRYEETIPLYKKYLQKFPEDIDIIEQLMISYEHTHKWEENISLLEPVNAKFPKRKRILEGMLNSYIALKDPKLITTLEEIIELGGYQQYKISIQGAYAGLFNNKSEQLKKYLQAYDMNPEDRYINGLLGQYYSSEGEIEKAFRHSIKSITCKYDASIEYLESFHSTKIYPTLALTDENRLTLGGIYDKNIKLEAELFDSNKKLNLSTRIPLLVLNKLLIESKVLNDTFENIEKSFELAGNYTNSGIVAMYMLFHASDYVSAPKVGDRIMNLLLKDPSINIPEKNTSIFRWFKKKSKNPIQITNSIISDNILNAEYLIKVNDPNKSFPEERQRLESEYVTQLFLHTHISVYEIEFRGKGENDALIVRKPVVFLKSKDKAMFIQRKYSKDNLEDIILEGDSDKIDQNMIAAVHSLAAIHTIATSALEIEGRDFFFNAVDGNNNAYISFVQEFNYSDNLERRFIQRIGNNKKLEQFKKEYNKFIGQSKYKFFLHGDCYPSNILSEGGIIDFEKRCIGNPMLDVAHLLAYPGLTKAIGYLEGYAKSFEKINANLGKDGTYIYTIINKEYLKNAVHVNLCLTGAMMAQDNIAYAQIYLKNAIQIIENIGVSNMQKTLIDYIRASPHKSLNQIL